VALRSPSLPETRAAYGNGSRFVSFIDSLRLAAPAKLRGLVPRFGEQTDVQSFVTEVLRDPEVQILEGR
jgi:hypothetical protein